MTKEGDVMVVIRTKGVEHCSPDCDWFEAKPAPRCHLARAEGNGPEDLLTEWVPGKGPGDSVRCLTCMACFP